MEAADNIDLRGINGSRWRNFGVVSNADIKLELDGVNSDDENFVPHYEAGYGIIKGNLSIKINTNFIEFQAIKIQVEGQSAVHYESNKDLNDMKPFEYKIHAFLLPTAVVGNRTVKRSTDDPSSQLIAHILRPQNTKEKRSLVKGQHNFPFELKWNGETLPGSIKTQQGRVQYKIVVYVKTWIAEITLLEKEFRCTGYLNLNPSLWALSYFQPMAINREKTKSFFSSKVVLSAELRLDKKAFVRGHDLPFQLTLRTGNNESEQQQISKITVFLVQKVIYTDNNYGKIMRETLDSTSMDGQVTMNSMSKKGEFQWLGQLFIPRNALPTFTVDVSPRKNGTVETNYQMQFEIEVKGKSSLKGEANVVIGTTTERKQ